MSLFKVLVEKSNSSQITLLITTKCMGATVTTNRSYRDFQKLNEALTPIMSTFTDASVPILPDTDENCKQLTKYLNDLMLRFGTSLLFCSQILDFLDADYNNSSELMKIQRDFLLEEIGDLKALLREAQSKSPKPEDNTWTKSQADNINNILTGGHFTEVSSTTANYLEPIPVSLPSKPSAPAGVFTAVPTPLVQTETRPTDNRSNSSSSGSKRELPNMIAMSMSKSDCDGIVDDLILSIQPKEDQVAYRASIRTFISKHVLKALEMKVFKTGLPALRCLLPDDQMRLSIVPWRGQTPDWYPTLQESLFQLTQLSKSRLGAFISDSSPNLIVTTEEDDMDVDFGDSVLSPVLCEHVVSRVSSLVEEKRDGDLIEKQVISYESNGNEISLIIDSTPVVIAANPHQDLCMLAFFEEVAILVGKDHLFKRSLLIIRAWWMYEAPIYVNGAVLKNVISDFALTVMLVAIFNQYHARIHHPLQALIFFISEYADLEWQASAVTIMGTMPFGSSDDKIPVIPFPTPGQLLNAEAITKYWNLFHATETSEGKKAEASGRQKKFSMCGCDNDPRLAMLELERFRMGADSGELPMPFSVASFCCFQRRLINIVCPLCNNNMVSNTASIVDTGIEQAVGLTNQGIYMLASVFKGASRSLMQILQDPKPSVQISQFFRETRVRFGIKSIYHSLHPFGAVDTSEVIGALGALTSSLIGAGNGLDHESSKVFDVSLKELWDRAHYCGLLTYGHLTGPALLALCKEVLYTHGALPVGEIGKALQKLTFMPHLFLLKEKFGGLKKFLERHREDFVISTAHPYNPCVFVRKGLSQEDIDCINKGFIPSRLTGKIKKSALLTKKVKSGQPTSSTSHGHSSYEPSSGIGMGLSGLRHHSQQLDYRSQQVPQSQQLSAHSLSYGGYSDGPVSPRADGQGRTSIGFNNIGSTNPRAGSKATYGGSIPMTDFSHISMSNIADSARYGSLQSQSHNVEDVVVSPRFQRQHSTTGPQSVFEPRLFTSPPNAIIGAPHPRSGMNLERQNKSFFGREVGDGDLFDGLMGSLKDCLPQSTFECERETAFRNNNGPIGVFGQESRHVFQASALRDPLVQNQHHQLQLQAQQQPMWANDHLPCDEFKSSLVPGSQQELEGPSGDFDDYYNDFSFLRTTAVSSLTEHGFSRSGFGSVPDIFPSRQGGLNGRLPPGSDAHAKRDALSSANSSNTNDHHTSQPPTSYMDQTSVWK